MPVVDEVTAVIVTRGNVDLSPIIESLPFQDVVVWDNSKRENLLVYGRYAAIAETTSAYIYVQDDDCIIPEPERLLGLHEPGTITANVPVSRWPDFPDSTLVGWGALFERDLPEGAFSRYKRYWSVETEGFYRTCDVTFTTLTPHVKVDLGFSHLPYAEGPDRMFKQAQHYGERMAALERSRMVRDGR